jgi:MinD superfamily P-loop ATPase
MPDSIQTLFEKTNEYLRVVDKPSEWYARVVTGTKENAENVSGVHADNVMAIIDEASGVENEIMDSVKGMMTSSNAILLMISNPKRLE